MSYTKITNFAIKDTYLTGNPAKIVKGAEIDAEFDAIATADAGNAKTASLGTSAFADLTASSLDTTANRVMKTGDAGWLNTGNGPVLVNLDTTATIPSGSGRYSSGVTLGTKPTDSAANGEVLVERFSSTIVKETWTDVVDGSAIAPREWVRTSYAVDTWGAWTEVFNAASTRLGFGVPASAWASGYSSIDIGWSGIASLNSSTATLITTNHYFDGTNYKYKNTGVAHNLVMGAFGSPLIVQTAASGSAGANVTFTDLMVLEATGDVTFGGNVKSGVIGTGQTWQNVTGSRVAGTIYTNSTGQPIEVAVTSQANPGTQDNALTVSGLIVSQFVDGTSAVKNTSTVSAIVPNGGTYSVDIGGGGIIRWMELRK